MENQMKIDSISFFKGFSKVLGVLVLQILNYIISYHTLKLVIPMFTKEQTVNLVNFPDLVNFFRVTKKFTQSGFDST